MLLRKKYAELILPLKLRGTLSYCVPEELVHCVEVGSWVNVMMSGREYLCVVEAISDVAPDILPNKLKAISAVVDLPKVEASEMLFWHNLADYYMCTVGEVFKAAYSLSFHKQVAIQGERKLKAEEKAVKAAARAAEEAQKPKRRKKRVAADADSCEAKESSGSLSAAGVSSVPEQLPSCEVNDGSEPLSVSGVFPLPELSTLQQEVLAKVKSYFSENKPVLLHGVTGSGKTEIYMHLAKEVLLRGKSVLYMVPEIALSAQLKSRLENVFGDKLLIFNSKQTAVQRKKVFDALKSSNVPEISEGADGNSRASSASAVSEDADGDSRASSESARCETSESARCETAVGVPPEAVGYIILGTRSAVLLPFFDLGLVIIDEEHDSSYKQADPAPRYNGRDAAMMLARQCGASVIMGSATPSFEAQYNVLTGKYARVELGQKFYGNTEPIIKIIDTNKAYRLHNMKGPFSMQLINEIRKTVDRGEQVMIFRSRRAYSPIVQCSECGEIPKCPKCNVSLSYHKFNNMLECHYCGYRKKYTPLCPKCGEQTLVNKGAGTEKIEEELKEYFPDMVIERFDADTTESKVREQKLLKDFAAGKINILVGTQMITKGFDFDRLALVAVIQADSLFSVQDFRADERAYQLLQQLRGRAGRRGKQGMIMIQTAQPEHPVVMRLVEESHRMDPDYPWKTEEKCALEGDDGSGLKEREIFCYPPYVRLLLISIKDRQQWRVQAVAKDMLTLFAQCGINNQVGPFAPAIEKVNGYHILQYWVKLPRNGRLGKIKQALSNGIELVKSKYNNTPTIVVDVDPY